MGVAKDKLAPWCRAHGKEGLLALYDESNSQSAEEAAYSSAETRKWRCPVCGMAWTGSTNKMNRLTPGSYNVVKKRPEKTYCPYCKGERASPGYSLLSERPWTGTFWDAERNGEPAEALERYLPGTHKKFFFRCGACGYAFPKPISPRDIDGELRCPECGEGRSREVTERSCLASRFPQIAEELADELNGELNGWNIRPSYQKSPLWFRCPEGHLYQAWVYNRTGRGDGCPRCGQRKRTSFMEQAIFYYLKKCGRGVRNNQTDRGSSIDVLLRETQVVVEYNSLYYHMRVRNEREAEALERSLDKYQRLSRYYRVFVVTEWEREAEALAGLGSPLIHPIPVPVYAYTKKTLSVYNQKILELLRLVFPNSEGYPEVDIQQDELEILAQYVSGAVAHSFQDQHPQLARDWDWRRNGTLAPNMFAPNTLHRFYWVCRSCGRSYRMSMGNRQKVNPDTCPICCRKSRYPSPLLGECYPELRNFWNQNLNRLSFDAGSVASERMGIFNGPEGQVVPVRICNISSWLWNHPDRRPEEYLLLQIKRQEKKGRRKP